MNAHRYLGKSELSRPESVELPMLNVLAGGALALAGAIASVAPARRFVRG
jgi:hypothetical protein